MAELSVQLDPVHLNLGCGRKYMKGWVNVDLEQRGDTRVDVQADIRELPFDDDYADTILANHVIEHFYRWEVEDILKDWFRALKPGGVIILECPDLMKCLENFRTSDNAYMHIYGLYGDQQYKDPLMQHKWAYCGRELQEILEGVGFVDVQQLPAEFHKKDERDMRVAGTKP